jgi:hypothetical protein
MTKVTYFLHYIFNYLINWVIGLTDMRDGSAEVVFNETLSLVVTMYKGADDKYQVCILLEVSFTCK